MPLAYLFATVLGGLVWTACYLYRPDIRRVMVGMSIVGIPLAVSDVFYVPSYWKPVTIGHVPIGIEGCIFSFEAAGICTVAYAVAASRRFNRLDSTEPPVRPLYKLIPLVLPMSIAAAIGLGLGTNLEWGLYTGLLAGCAATVFIRRDLLLAGMLGGLAFTPVYTLALIIWVAVFPSVHYWFILKQMPHWYLAGVPLTEIVFGGLFAAYWTGLYPLVFDRRFVPLSESGSAAIRPARDQSAIHHQV